MKKNSIAAALILLIAFAAPAFAAYGDGNFYAAVRGGAGWDSINISNVNFDTGYGITGALGYDVSVSDFDQFRVRGEVEFGYASVSANMQSGVVSGTDKIDSIPLMVNGLVDFYVTEQFYLYGGGGLGALFSNENVNVNAPGVSVWGTGSSVQFCTQVRVGLGYKITETVALEAGYRLLVAAPFDDHPLIKNMIEAGIVLRF